MPRVVPIGGWVSLCGYADSPGHRVSGKARQNTIILVRPWVGAYNARPLGSLAQLVEHRAFNPLVLGSNPRRPTNTYAPSIRRFGYPDPGVPVRATSALSSRAKPAAELSG